MAVLKIQAAQISACDQVARANFVQRVQVHLKTYFVDDCEQLGDAELVKLIETGIVKAATHDIEAEEGVAKFITLMLVYGKEFDSDGKHAWATQVLKDKELATDPILKADALYDAATSYEESLL